MKKVWILPAALLLLNACGGTEENVSEETCKVDKLEISCDSAEVYNHFLEMEAAINATFDGKTTVYSFEERLTMREDLTNYYSENKGMLDAIYPSLKKASSVQMDPAEINQMRVEEVALFEADKQAREEAQAFLNDIEFSQYETDTTIYDYAGEEHYLILKIKNTSDKIVTSFLVSNNVEKEGEIHYQTTPTTQLFTADQLSPRPADESSLAALEPGQTLYLTFDTNEKNIAKPEIVGVTFQ